LPPLPDDALGGATNCGNRLLAGRESPGWSAQAPAEPATGAGRLERGVGSRRRFGALALG